MANLFPIATPSRPVSMSSFVCTAWYVRLVGENLGVIYGIGYAKESVSTAV